MKNATTVLRVLLTAGLFLGLPHATMAATGLVRVSGSEFAPGEFSVDYRIGSFGIAGEGGFIAPVRGIPAGATITNVTMYAKDGSETLDISLAVAKTRIENGKGWGIANLASSGTTRRVRPFTATQISFGTIEDDQIVSLYLWLPENNRDSLLFTGATIEYSLP